MRTLSNPACFPVRSPFMATLSKVTPGGGTFYINRSVSSGDIKIDRAEVQHAATQHKAVPDGVIVWNTP